MEANEKPVLVLDVPAAMADDLVAAGIGRPRQRRRGAADVITFILGTGGGLVTLLQTPTTLRDFAAWAHAWALSRRTTLLFRAERGRDGTITLEISPQLSREAAVDLVERTLKAVDG